MKTFTATEAKNQLGAVIDAALAEPVAVKKSGRVSVVIVSVSEYERLSALEDAYWAARAIIASSKGFVGADELAKLIEDTRA